MLADLLAIEDCADEPLDPQVWVEPKDRDVASEDARQARFVATMKHGAKGCRVFAVPNGAKRSRWEAAKAKREGMHAGWPDVGVVWADAAVWIEFKAGRTGPSQDQIDTLNWLVRRGHSVAVCRTAEGALGWLRSIGAPVAEVRP